MSRGLSALAVLVTIALGQNERWIYEHPNAGPFSEATSIAVGLDGTICAAGITDSLQTGCDFTLVGLAPSGGLRWAYRYNGFDSADDGAYSVVCGSDGNLAPRYYLWVDA
jgi:hypothetical protein